MSLVKDTVAISFSSGIQPSQRERLLPPEKLLVAQNCSFIRDEGPQKRNGHVSRVIRTSADYVGMGGIPSPTAMPGRQIYSTANPNISPNWLLGWGIRGTELATSTSPFEVSPQANAGQVLGQASRDDEIISWDGFRAFVYAPLQTAKFGEPQNSVSPGASIRGPWVMPTMRVEPVAKISDSQLFPDAADNGVLRVVAWINSDLTSIGYSVYDSSNGACLVFNQRFTGGSAKSVRCITVGTWFHILVSDSNSNTLTMRSFQQDSPTSVTTRSLGPVDNQFDCKKIDEHGFVVIRSKASVITAIVLNQDGSTNLTFTPNLFGNPANTNNAIACAVDFDKNIGIAWQSGAGPVTTFFAVYSPGGAPINVSSPATVTTSTARRLTLAPRAVGTNISGVLWDVFIEDLVSGQVQTRCVTVQAAATSGTATATRHRVTIASHAFQVGNRTFLWCSSPNPGTVSGLQTSWYLCDASLQPVGKMSYGTANADFGTTLNTLPSVNWHTDDDMHPGKDRIVFHGALGYKQRVQSTALSPRPSGVFTEPSVNFYKLDFIPKLRAGQAGRATYFAGAQLWAYDGAELAEACFHQAPEGTTYTPAGGGSMSAGTYRYRIDLCHKNAQNEEVRSWSIISNAVISGASGQVTIVVPTMPMTRREDAYFLIYRTQANGTVFTLCNSRDPSSALFLRNNQANVSATLVDQASDATISTQEYHPANAAGNYLDPLPAPACEVVAGGRDRLWLAGGELAPGELSPSRLFQPKEAPAFSPALNIQIDRNDEPVTAIGFLNNIAVVFRRTASYIIESDGPDNSLNGAWVSPRKAISDTGAIGPEGLAVTTAGLWFQAPIGLRLMTNGGSMDPQAGQDVDPITAGASYSAAVVVPQYTQVRWYSSDPSKPTVVVDYSSNSWSTWTGLTCVGANFWPITDLAVISKGDGYIWREDSTIYTDNGLPYEHIVRTAWLRGAQLGDFQRFRRFALFGNSAAPVSLRCRIFYDERPFHDEEFVLDFPLADGLTESIFNTSIWGGSSLATPSPVWGNFSVWGDSIGQTQEVGVPLYFNDGVFKFRHRPARQKCSVFSIEFSDLGAPNSSFEPVVLALEIAKKKGLDRIPSGNYGGNSVFNGAGGGGT